MDSISVIVLKHFKVLYFTNLVCTTKFLKYESLENFQLYGTKHPIIYNSPPLTKRLPHLDRPLVIVHTPHCNGPISVSSHELLPFRMPARSDDIVQSLVLVDAVVSHRFPGEGIPHFQVVVSVAYQQLQGKCRI